MRKLNLILMPGVEGSWSKAYNDLLVSEFPRYFDLKVWQEPSPEECERAVFGVAHSPDELWFFSMAQDPLCEKVWKAYPTAKIFGHVHGSQYMPFMANERVALKEKVRLPLYTRLFTNSSYGKLILHQNDLRLWGRVEVVGFPMNLVKLQQYTSLSKLNQIGVAQRFAVEKNFPIVIEVARRMRNLGLEVVQMVGSSEEEFHKSNPCAVFRGQAEGEGLTFCFNKTKEDYYTGLAKCSKVLFTSLMENMSTAAIEAAEMECHVVAPDLFSFREILPESHLYKPFDLDEIVAKLERPYETTQGHKWNDHRQVVDRYAMWMEE